MAMSAGSGGGVKAEPNMTPMIDVMLVLLVIFMIIIPTLTSGLNAVPPSGSNLKPKPEGDDEQILGIDVQGTYYLNRDAIAQDDLGPALKAIFERPGRDEFILYVKADKGLKYAAVLDALDVAAHSGVRVSALITDQTPGTVSKIESDNISIIGSSRTIDGGE